MYQITLDPTGNYDEATPAQSVSATAAAIFEIRNPNRRGIVIMTFNVGAAGTLTTFYITRSAFPGGTQLTWKTGSDFNTPTVQQPETLNFSLPQAASSSFQLLINMSGVSDMQIWAASTAGTTLQLEVGATSQ